MAIRDNAEIIYVARNSTQRIISVNLFRGSRLPVYCSALGKSLLIDLAQQELFDLLGDAPISRLSYSARTEEGNSRWPIFPMSKGWNFIEANGRR